MADNIPIQAAGPNTSPNVQQSLRSTDVGAGVQIPFNFLVGSDGVTQADVAEASTVPEAADKALVVTASPNAQATYSASSGAFASALLATDIFTISGSATKTVKIQRIILTADQTTASVVVVNLVKRSALDTAGTSTTLTAVPYSSASAAATAVVKSYTANPTALGASVGNVSSDKLVITNSTGGGLANQSAGGLRYEWSWGDGNQTQPIVLLTAAENLAINLGGVTVVGGSFNIVVEWTEET